MILWTTFFMLIIHTVCLDYGLGLDRIDDHVY